MSVGRANRSVNDWLWWMGKQVGILLGGGQGSSLLTGFYIDGGDPSRDALSSAVGLLYYLVCKVLSERVQSTRERAINPCRKDSKGWNCPEAHFCWCYF